MDEKVVRYYPTKGVVKKKRCTVAALFKTGISFC
jgi:hypothetical protein